MSLQDTSSNDDRSSIRQAPHAARSTSESASDIVPRVKKLLGRKWAVYFPEGKSKLGSESQDNSLIAGFLIRKLEGNGERFEPQQIQDWITDLNGTSNGSAWKLEQLVHATVDGGGQRTSDLPSITRQKLASSPTINSNDSENRLSRLSRAVAWFALQIHAITDWLLGMWTTTTEQNRCCACNDVIRAEPSISRKNATVSKYCRSCLVENQMEILRRDAETRISLVRSSLLKCVTINPLLPSTQHFFTNIATLAQVTSHDVKAAIYAEAFTTGDQIAIDSNAVEEAWRGASGVLSNELFSIRTALDDTFPTWNRFISHLWIIRPEETIQRELEKLFSEASEFNDITSLQQQFQSLSNRYQRYLRIKSGGSLRTYVINPLIDFAAKTIGSEVGETIGEFIGDDSTIRIASKVGWHIGSRIGKDAQYNPEATLESIDASFDTDVVVFSEYGRSFTQKYQAVLVDAVDQFISDMCGMLDSVNSGFEKASLRGIATTRTFRALRLQTTTS